VYPPRDKAGRWRAVWHEVGERQQCESVSEDKPAAKLEKVRQRLSAGAANMTRPGADLIAWYLNPDRLRVADRWSRKHADTQRRLCQRYAAPVIGAVACQDITVSHTQKIVNAAPTAGEGDRVHRMLSAEVGAGLKGGLPRQPDSGRGPLEGRRPPAARPEGNGRRRVRAAGRPLRDPVQRRYRRTWAGPGSQDPWRAGRADGQPRYLQRTAVGRTDRPHYPAGRRCRTGDHGGPQGGRDQRADLSRGAEEPQVPPHHLPAPEPGRVVAEDPDRDPQRMGRVGLALSPVPLMRPRHQRQSGADAGAQRAREPPGLNQQPLPQPVFPVHRRDRVQGMVASSRPSSVLNIVSPGAGFAVSCGTTVSPSRVPDRSI